MKIGESIDKVMIKEQAEENSITVDTFSPMRNESENIINQVKNLTIHDIINDLIDKFADMAINDTVNDMISCVANLTNKTINDIGNNLNGANASVVQVQFLVDPAEKNTKV